MSRVYQQSATGKCAPQNAPRTNAVGGRHDAIVVFLNTQNDYKYELCADSGPEFSVLIAGERATLILRLGVARGSRRGPLTCSGRWTWPSTPKHRGARGAGGGFGAGDRPTHDGAAVDGTNKYKKKRPSLSEPSTHAEHDLLHAVRGHPESIQKAPARRTDPDDQHLRVLAAVKRRPSVRSSVKANKMGASEYVCGLRFWRRLYGPLPAERRQTHAARPYRPELRRRVSPPIAQRSGWHRNR